MTKVVHMISPVITVVQATSLSVAADSFWKTSGGTVVTPNINGFIESIYCSFETTNDASCTFDIYTRDLKAAVLCNFSNMSASTTVYPRIQVTDAVGTGLLMLSAGASTGETSWGATTNLMDKIAVAGSLQISGSAMTSSDTCKVEIVYSR